MPRQYSSHGKEAALCDCLQLLIKSKHRDKAQQRESGHHKCCTAARPLLHLQVKVNDVEGLSLAREVKVLPLDSWRRGPTSMHHANCIAGLVLCHGDGHFAVRKIRMGRSTPSSATRLCQHQQQQQVHSGTTLWSTYAAKDDAMVTTVLFLSSNL